MKTYYLDDGKDNNLDGHCDIDGWFVDRSGGHHKVVERTIASERQLLKSFGKVFSTCSLSDVFGKDLKLSKEELEMLVAYSKNDPDDPFSSPTMNKILRRNLLCGREMMRHFDRFDAMMEKCKTKKDIIVYRGMGLCRYFDITHEIPELRRGDRIKDPAYMSTSFSKEKALEYALKNPSDMYVLYKINVKAGTKCLPLFHYIERQDKIDEREILFPRGTVLRAKSGKIMFYEGRQVYFVEMESVE